MAEPQDFTVARVRAMQERLRSSIRDDMFVEQAAQHLTDTLWDAFGSDVVLARTYATLAYGTLPSFNQRFVQSLANATPYASKLGAYTPVLSLLATRGLEMPWNDRKASKGHIGVPFLAADFLRSLPMVTALLGELGLTIESIVEQGSNIAVHSEQVSSGEAANVFYVPSATTSLDAQGRQIIPAQDFVHRHGVETVFGFGGAWPNRSLLSCIVFLRRPLERAVVRRLAPILGSFRAATTAAAMRGRYFVDPPAGPESKRFIKPG